MALKEKLLSFYLSLSLSLSLLKGTQILRGNWNRTEPWLFYCLILTFPLGKIILTAVLQQGFSISFQNMKKQEHGNDGSMVDWSGQELSVTMSLVNSLLSCDRARPGAKPITSWNSEIEFPVWMMKHDDPKFKITGRSVHQRDEATVVWKRTYQFCQSSVTNSQVKILDKSCSFYTRLTMRLGCYLAQKEHWTVHPKELNFANQ